MFNWFKSHTKKLASYDGPTIDTEQFEFKLSHMWKQEVTSDPEQFHFTTKDGTSITLSCLKWDMPADRLPDAGEVLIRSRGAAIGEGLGDHKYELSALNVIPVPYPGLEIYVFGAARKISYYSRFFALLTEGFMLQLYVESPASEDEKNQRNFDSVLKGLGIKHSDGRVICASQANVSG